MKPGHHQVAEQTERLRRAAHLRDTIIHRSQERNHPAAHLARILDMSVGHWYRIKKEPLRLSRLTLARLDATARYVGWPRVQVLVAVGWLQQAEIEEVISVPGALEQALQRLQRGGLTNGLATPLSRASADHQLLMARLLLAAESAVATRSAQDAY